MITCWSNLILKTKRKKISCTTQTTMTTSLLDRNTPKTFIWSKQCPQPQRIQGLKCQNSQIQNLLSKKQIRRINLCLSITQRQNPIKLSNLFTQSKIKQMLHWNTDLNLSCSIDRAKSSTSTQIMFEETRSIWLEKERFCLSTKVSVSDL